MPNKCLTLMQECETLPQICLDLHMSVVGSSEPLTEKVFIRYLRCLEVAVDNWDHSLDRTAMFDNAVLNLIVATLSEIRLRLRYNLVYKDLGCEMSGSMSEFFEKSPDMRFYL